MKLKMRLLVVPSLLAAGLLGACGQDSNQGAGISTPAAPDVDVVQSEETPVMGEDQVGAATTPDVAVEEEAGAATTPDTAVEEEAGAATTPDTAVEEEAGAATTPDAVEEEAGAEATPGVVTEEQADVATTPGMEQFDMMSAYKASEFIGYHVQNSQGEDLGEIEDLMVDLGASQVRYAVLSFGGFLDIGDKLFAIPLDAIQFNPEEQAFILDVDQERLEQAPAFERENWPDTTNPDWDMGYSDFWLEGTTDQAGTETNPDAATEEEAGAATTPEVATEEQAATEDQDTMTDQPMAGAVVRASEIIDDEIYNSQDEEIGNVEDLVVQMGDQHMVYAVLSLSEMDDELAESGDTADSADTTAQTDAAAEADQEAIQDKLYAIPLTNLQFNAEEDTFVFNPDPQMLDTALSFSEDEWSNQMNLEDVN